MLLINEWVNNEIKDEIKIYLNTNEDVDTKIQKSVELWESNPKREIHSITGLSQKKIKKKRKKKKISSNKQSNFALKGTLKRTKNKAQNEQKEGNNKDLRRNKQNRG